jgi:hypothetical protein
MLSYEREQPRLGAARNRQDEKSGVNQCGQVTFELSVVDKPVDQFGATLLGFAREDDFILG